MFLVIAAELEAEHGYVIDEALGETVAQYRNEVAQFGDAWPGAALEIDRLRARAAAQRPVSAGAFEWLRAGRPVEAEVAADDDSNIPF